MSKSEATCRRGVCPSRLVRNVSEAHASPADRGFGLMARGPGRIPCRIASDRAGHERLASAPPPRRCGCLVRGSLDPGARSASSVSSRCQRLHRRTGSCRRAFGLDRHDCQSTRSPPRRRSSRLRPVRERCRHYAGGWRGGGYDFSAACLSGPQRPARRRRWCRRRRRPARCRARGWPRRG